MQTRIETISKGIIRVRRSEDFKETWLERYKILNAQPEEGADAGFTVTENAVTLPSGRVLPMNIWTDAQDKAWNDRLNAMPSLPSLPPSFSVPSPEIPAPCPAPGPPYPR